MFAGSEPKINIVCRITATGINYSRIFNDSRKHCQSGTLFLVISGPLLENTPVQGDFLKWGSDSILKSQLKVSDWNDKEAMTK